MFLGPYRFGVLDIKKTGDRLTGYNEPIRDSRGYKDTDFVYG